ncbi:MAG: hypothetical protein A4E53_04656 [Pelotomaculum sp. PtaB.Bin104]|nr:MAG: hypothetical protein A4E53_04656 [Pelotomaculum sp. PtaB.Bin104]
MQDSQGKTVLLLTEKTEDIYTWKIINSDVPAIIFFSLSNKQIGSFLLDFLAVDFNNIEHFNNFINIYGLSSLVGLSKTTKDIFANKSEGKWIKGFEKIYEMDSKDKYSRIMERIYNESNTELKILQDIFKRAIYLCFDVNGPEWSKGLTVFQRFAVIETMMSKTAREIRDEAKHTTYDFQVVPDTDSVSRTFPAVYYIDEIYAEVYANQIRDINYHKVEKCTCDSPGGICYASFKKLLENNALIKKCQHCGDYFIPSKRIDEEYCDKVVKTLPGGITRTCKDVGPMLKYSKKDKDPLIIEYRRAYKNRHSKLKKGLTKEEFYYWKEEATLMMKGVRQGKYSIEEFKEWCKKDKGES